MVNNFKMLATTKTIPIISIKYFITLFYLVQKFFLFYQNSSNPV